MQVLSLKTVYIKQLERTVEKIFKTLLLFNVVFANQDCLFPSNHTRKTTSKLVDKTLLEWQSNNA